MNEANILKVSPSPAGQDATELKLNTSLSIPQLAFIIRLFVEEKIITNTNQSEVLKFFSTNLSTIRQENISYNHLRAQYYKPELSAVEAVKKLLLRLLHLSRKME